MTKKTTIEQKYLKEWETADEALEALRIAHAKTCVDILAPPPRVKGSDWANDHVVLLSQGGATEPGYYRWQRQPFQREPMDVLTDKEHQEVVLMWGVRSGKSVLMGNATAYYAAAEPSPIMWVLPTEVEAKRVSQMNIDSIFESPKLKGILRDRKARDSGNNVLTKKFAGGVIMMAGANSPTGLRARTVRVLMMDEISDFDATIGEEGSPIELAKNRTVSFGHRKKIVYSSTPSITDFCPVAREFKESDQRYYHVPCPKCEHKQKLIWKHLNYADDPKNPVYICANEDCGYAIPESKKMWMLENGEWVADNPKSEKAGFHLNSLYSTMISWDYLVSQWLKSKDDNHLLQVFINSFLAETFDLEGSHTNATTLEKRLEKFEADVPDGVGIITCGVDVQENRLEALVVGWGEDDEAWLIDAKVFPGDTIRNDVWDDLKKFLLQTRYRNKNGAGIGIRATAIDSGHNPQIIHEFVDGFKRHAPSNRVCIAIKGQKSQPRVIADRPKTSATYGSLYYNVGTDVSKEFLASVLNNSEPGPKYLHLPLQLPTPPGERDRWLDQEVLAQLTSEKLVVRWKGNRVHKQWRKTRTRNEAWDCLIYSYAVYHHLGGEVRQRIGEMAEKVSSLTGNGLNKDNPTKDTPKVKNRLRGNPKARVHQPRRKIGQGFGGNFWRY